MRKILVPTDFTEVASFATEMATKLAAKLDAEIILLHVVNLPTGVLIDDAGRVIDDGENDLSSYKKLLVNVNEKMTALKASLSDNIKTEVIEGVLNTALIDYINAEQIDLVVMGTKGAKGLREILQGSETEIIVRRSPVPVLSLMCDRSDIKLDSILLVHDFKKSTKQNLEILKVIATAFNAKIHLLKIVDDNESELVAEKNMHDFANINELIDVQCHIFKDNGVEEGITHFLQEHDFDLLSIGTHGHTGYKHWTQGSIAEDLVNHLHKPILTYHLN